MRKEQNELLTRSSLETPGGSLLRQFWQPVALARELTEERPLVSVKVLHESLILFRNEDGKLGLIDRHCAHRGADLSYGRLEDGGVRCPFHGWLFDIEGQCLEQPAEPLETTFCHRIKLKNYPVVERNGVIFAWMSDEPEQPLLSLACFDAPEPWTFAFKGLVECNWLQALEVGIDPAHASFLHRYLVDDDPTTGYGQQFRDVADMSNIPVTQLLREYPRPEIFVDETSFGLRLTAIRYLSEHQVHVRVTNQVFPQAIVIPMSRSMSITQWHVPIDDVSCYWYAIFTSIEDPIDQQKMYEQRTQLYELPEYRSKTGKNNNYGYDPLEQRTRTYTGMGDDINVHDQWAIESQGVIQDRTKEHLGRSDIGIIHYRRLLKSALASGKPRVAETHSYPPNEKPVSIDIVLPALDWQSKLSEKLEDLNVQAQNVWAGIS